MVEITVVAHAEAAAGAAAERLVSTARSGGHIALAGGSTPRRAYELAAVLEPDWSGAEVWWGDERCVPPDDERSNFGMAHAALLEQLERQPRAVHRIRGELEGQRAAAEYDDELDGVVLDLALLGIGPDGHTASLFPNAPQLRERERRAVAAEPGLEPFVERVTLTIPVFSAAADVLFLVAGEEKADAVRRAFVEAPDERTPASLVRGVRTLAILDRAAAIALPEKTAR